MTKILVLDDDRDWFTRCEEALSSKGIGGLGFEMRLCTGDAGALADIWDRVPDVVFLGMSFGACGRGEGHQMLWLLGDILPGVPVVICSSEGDLSAMESGPGVGGPGVGGSIEGGAKAVDAALAGAAAFLHKFAGPAEIVGTTMRVLGRTFPMGGGAGLLDCGEAFDSMVH